jgi:hypothetical protein
MFRISAKPAVSDAAPQLILPRHGDLSGTALSEMPPQLERFYRYWLALPQMAEGLPLRRSFRPEMLRDLLPNVLMLDVEEERGGERRYRYRLIGTAHRPHMPGELTGRYVDEVQPYERYRRGVENFSQIIAARSPAWWRNYSMIGEVKRLPYHEYERVLAPFADEDGNVRLLIGVWIWGDMLKSR